MFHSQFEQKYLHRQNPEITFSIHQTNAYHSKVVNGNDSKYQIHIDEMLFHVDMQVFFIHFHNKLKGGIVDIC